MPLSHRHINHTLSDTDTTCIHTDSHTHNPKHKKVEKTQIQAPMQKDAHASLDTHTQRAVGIL